MRIISTLGVALVGFSMIVAVNVYGKTETRKPEPYKGLTAGVVGDAGKMSVPADYRTVYQMLGTWAVAETKGSGSKEMHVVYASPGTIAAFRKDGHFHDGAVLVKEVFKTTTKSMTTGTVSSADKLVGWFVMVKDDVGRFPKNKLWGDGWGWAWFDVANPNQTTSTNYKENCQTCHVPARESDWIYTFGYPVLKP